MAVGFCDNPDSTKEYVPSKGGYMAYNLIKIQQTTENK